MGLLFDSDVPAMRLLTTKTQWIDFEREKKNEVSISMNKVVDLFTFQTETWCNILFNVDVLCSKQSD